MGQLWAIVVGINHYPLFPQPLQYAGRDAALVYRELQQRHGLSTPQGLLLSDSLGDLEAELTPDLGASSPDGNDRLPTRDTLWRYFQGLCSSDRIQEDDYLWIFFSGYGLHDQGEDYLMPWDGNPSQVAETGIPLRSLLHLVHGANTKHSLLLLDINHSQGLGDPRQAPGAQVADLAEQFGISTLLSCQPQEFSQESPHLRSGLFTASLLEALAQPEITTLGTLINYLLYRLPEICNHYWKPPQTPLLVGSWDQDLFPVPGLPQAIPQPLSVHSTTATLARSSPLISQISQEVVTGPSLPNTSPNLPSLPDRPPFLQGDPAMTAPLPWPQVVVAVPPQDSSRGIAPWLWMVGIVGSLATLGFVGLASQGLLTLPEQNGLFSLPKGATDQRLLYGQLPETSDPTDQPAPVPSPGSLATRNQLILRQARSLIQDTQASQFSEAIALARQIAPGQPLYQEAQQDMERWSQVIFDLALGRAQRQDYGAAIEAAQLVPWDQPLYQDAQTAIAYWQQQLGQAATEIAEFQQVRTLINPESASSYNQAIAILKTIPADHPQYFQAQRLQGEWSRAILALAEERAAQGNYTQAVAAAALVPEGTPYYDLAQTSLTDWENRLAPQRASLPDVDQEFLEEDPDNQTDRSSD